MVAIQALTENEKALISILLDHSGLDQAEFLMKAPSEDKSDGRWRARPYQWPWYRCRDKYQIDMAGRSVGKAIALDTDILTSTGWKTMETIQVGDFVYNEWFKPVKVIAVHDVQYGRPCYEIDFDGTKVIADEDHQWVTQSTLKSKSPLTTKDIYRTKQGGHLHSVYGKRITSIEPTDSVPVRCIEVDGQSKLFCITQSMIPTHNSESIKLRAIAFPFIYPGLSLLITAPRQSHLKLIYAEIEQLVQNIRLLDEMILPTRGGKSIAKSPYYEITFKNGSKLLGKIPGLDGSGIKGCEAAGTLVLTKEKGLVPIQNMEIGLHVLTHKKRWKKVTHTWEFNVDRYAKVAGHGHRELITSDIHKFYAKRNRSVCRKKNLADADWVRVDDPEVDERWYWAMPDSIPQEPISSLGFVQSEEEFYWICGRFLADGYTSGLYKQKGIPGKQSRTIFTVHENKANLLYDKILKGLGIVPTIRDRDGKKKDVYFVDETIGEWLYDTFGKYANGKSIPSFIFTAPDNIRQAVLDGYLAGDGHLDIKRGRWSFGSASRELAMGMKMLAQTLGWETSFTWVDPKTTEICGTELKTIPQRSWQGLLVKSDPFGRTGLNQEDGFWWGRIRNVEMVEKPLTVYDLTVEDDASYCADGIIHHNTHPQWLEMDEASDYPSPGWSEIIETLRDIPGATWRAHGVSRGVGDEFDKRITNSMGEWTIHKIPRMNSPEWNDEIRKNRISEYGSRDDPNYRRNVHGEAIGGDSPIFVLSRFAKIMDDEEESNYNTEEYFHIRISHDMLNDFGGSIEQYLAQEIPYYPDKYKIWWGGADLGLTNDPTEILIFAEEELSKNDKKLRLQSNKKVPLDGQTYLKALCRINLTRISAPDQARALIWLFENRFPVKAFGMDTTGIGLPIWQGLQEKSPLWVKRVRDFNFSAKIIVDFIEDEAANIPTSLEDSGKKEIVKVYATEVLRKMVDNGRIWLPGSDDELIRSFLNQNEVKVKSIDAYGKSRYSSGHFHILDSARMAALAWDNYSIDKMIKNQKQEPVYDLPVYDDDEILSSSYDDFSIY